MKSRGISRFAVKALPLLIAAAFPAVTLAQAFDLGEVRITTPRVSAASTQDQVASIISQEQIRQFNRDDVGSALNLLSGVNLTTNVRNEKMVFMRGYDARQTPLFIDGVPVYVPYDGYVDFARFTTADLDSIQVAKGFSSIAYGPNTLGGAINLVSRKPLRAFEGDARVGAGAGGEILADANVGTRQGAWYLQAGASYAKADNFPLSGDFVPTATENGGSRENSYRKDSKISFKAGWLPRATDEYVVSYYKQEGEKGQPPQTNVPAASARYWRWPFWDKESVSFASRTALGEVETLKLRAYLDKYGNGLDMYTNGSFSAISPGGQSVYDDSTRGASFELQSVRLPRQTLKLVGQYKQDRHVALDGVGATTETFKDKLTYWGVEDNIEIGEAALLSLGWADASLTPQQVFKVGSNYSLPQEQSKAGAQAGLFYDLSSATRLYATAAQKTRLPTLKDRYSARLNTYVENPGLRPEEALNLEAGYLGTPWAGAQAEAAVFHNTIDDKIQTVYAGNATSCSATAKCRMDNVGKVQVEGIEMGLNTPVTPWLLVGGNYTHMWIKNISSPATKITDIPSDKLFLNATVKPHAQFDLVAWVEYEHGRWANNTVELPSFTVLSGKVVVHPTEALAAEVGATNLTDRNYALADGFPSPGRSWFANLRYRF
jgi:iron complex outermembrane receptor protein